jgi:mxaA protein
MLGVLGAALIGLLYILGESKWMPRMGGAFAQAVRDLRKIPDTSDGIATAVARIHQAFNTTANSSVFDSAEFLRLKPGFSSIGADIDRFFALSRSVFFDPNLPHGVDKPAAWLKQFCRRCRDCERGLK